MTEQEQKFELLIRGIVENGYAICDNFLDKMEVENLLKTLSTRYEQGNFKQASIGKYSEVQKNIDIRGDEILWLDNQSIDLAERVLLDKNQEFINYLNQTCFLGIIDSEIHFAKYAKGKFYRRHRDSFQTKKGRVLSVIYYLNFNWVQENGGNLIIYDSKSGIEEAITITPLAGRMVCFESEKLDHEVTEALLDRFSVTGWLLNRR
jgi:SM-20-related protein